MTEAEGTQISVAQFLEYLKTLPWCKQERDVLIAVHKGEPEIIAMLPDHEVKVYPSGMNVKLNKSVLHNFQEKYDEGAPLPVVVAWKKEGVEIWYRRAKPTEFPYDAWMDSTHATQERERVFIPQEEFGPEFATAHADHLSKAKSCPTMIPQH
ncbi:MAG TPA: hypothetical protein V6C72_06435 [Chroococcales cyanobacterium]